MEPGVGSLNPHCASQGKDQLRSPGGGVAEGAIFLSICVALDKLHGLRVSTRRNSHL